MFMKKILAGIMIGIVLSMSTAAFSAILPVKIVLDGKELYADTPPQVINDRVFVPIRAVSEALGVDVEWDKSTRTVIMTSPQNMPAFKVLSYNKMDNQYGYSILGEVRNTSSKTYSKARITAEIIDSGGKIIETVSSQLPPGITPGETAYFRLRSFSANSPLIKKVNFKFETSNECDITPTNVIFFNVKMSRDDLSGFIYATGEAERTGNDFKRKYKHPVVQIALFDKSGNIINYGEADLVDYELMMSREFKIAMEMGPEYSTYKLKCFSD